MLEVVHLVESARYHLLNLDRLTSGEGSAPSDFQSSGFTGAELDTHWRTMVHGSVRGFFIRRQTMSRPCVVLFENALDLSAEIHTLGAAIFNLDKRIKDERIKS
jgi:hypothetical protein